MTVPSSVAKSGPYLCNGVTDVFNYDFRIVDKAHLQVILADANGIETTLTLTTHYTVSDVGSDTGSINLTSAGVALAVTGTTLTILRNPPFTQETDLQNQGAYLAETVEDRFDLAVMQIQTLKEKLDRAIVIQASDDSTTGDELSADVARLADSADNIDVAAQNVADINTVADNITDIQNAEENAAAAAASASAAATSESNAAASDTSAEAAADRAEAAANSVDFVTADTPDDITLLSPDVSAPAINVLGYPTSPGAANAWVRADAAPASGPYRTDAKGQVWVPNPFTIHAEHFGAWAHGKRVDQTLQAAIDFAVANRAGYCRVIMPPGIGVLETNVVKTIDGVGEDFRLKLEGAGLDITCLHVDATSGASGIHVTQPQLGRGMITQLADFSVLADGITTDEALKFTRATGGVRHGSTFMLDNVRVAQIEGAYATDYCKKGLNISGQLIPRINRFMFTGVWGPGAPTNKDDASPLYAPDYGILMDNTYGGEIVESQVWSARFGILNRWVVDPGGEGLRLFRCNLVAVVDGVHWERVSTEPTFWAEFNHINSRNHAFYINGCKMVNIARNNLYNEDTNNEGSGSVEDVYLKNIQDVELTENTHHFNGNTNRIAYRVDGTGLHTKNIRIQRPVLTDGVSMAALLYVNNTASNLEVIDPQIAASVVSGSLIQGGGALSARVRYTDPLTTRVWLQAANQTIANDFTAPTPMSWDTVDVDNSGLFNIGNPTKVVIPAGKGIRRAKFKAQIPWSSASLTGTRQLHLQKNGGTTLGGFAIENSGSSRLMMANTGWLAVADGDEFIIGVAQNSGGDLDVIAGQSCFFEIEVC